MSESSNPLDVLFVDNSSLDLELLAATIVDYVKINAEKAEVIFTVKGRGLKNKEKILAYLLARKAMHMKGIIEDESIGPSDIERETGIKGNTLRPILGRLRDESIIRNDNGKYYIHNHALHDVSKILLNPEVE